MRDPRRNLKRGIGIAAGVLAVAGLLAWWAWPEPLVVETAKVARGPVQVTIEEDGETRARDRYVVAAPVAGRLLRIRWREGDTVKAGERIAEIAPVPLSPADREQLEAKLAATRALKREADDRAARVQADLEQAGRERERVEDLVARKFMSAQALEQALLAQRLRENDLKAARSHAAAAAAEIEAASAALAAVRAKAPTIVATSPVEGRILAIPEKSERVVSPGMPLATIGDPRALEIVVDLLSSDAVKVKPGMRMLITGWGGPDTLEANVRLIEPAAFRKVSALGVEEQRVNVIGDFRAQPASLGDGFRIDARIVVDEKPDALKVPVGAVFRRGTQWSVFEVEAGKARLKNVEIGLRGAREVEIVGGLAERDEVVLYPGSELADGKRIRRGQAAKR